MRNYKRLCKDIEKVENYEKALADNFVGWDLHHRLETHNSDGERRIVDIKSTELAALDMYWNRPASELIFLTVKEHAILHKKGKHRSEETKKKISEANKGEKHHMYGKHHSEETRKKISEAKKNISDETRKKLSIVRKGKHPSEEARKRMSEAHKGKPVPWEGKPRSAEHRKKNSEAHKGNQNVKGRHYYNNGKINVMRFECPEGFVPGRLI